MNQTYNNILNGTDVHKMQGKELEVNVTEMILTPLTCASLINEIIKYLIYQKSQVPYTYNWLKSAMNRKQGAPECETKPLNLTAERHYKVVCDAYETLENIMKNMNSEFKNFGEDIKQVIILFGSTVYSPREMYTIRVKSLAKGHLEENHLHGNTRNQHKILGNIVFAEEWSSAMESSIPLTNMYILLQKHSNIHHQKEENFFLPNMQYSLPTGVKNTVINLNYNEKGQYNCCNNLAVFEDSSTSINNESTVTTTLNDLSNDNLENCDNSTCDLLWFQADVTLKGFKECFIKNVSATELW